jgi:phage shock protein PspC (stress-responsive transcriptional regulator)
MDRLYRSRDDRMLAGVAGGLAEMWGADPSLVRVIWALLVVFTGGIALLVYIVMALVVPEEPLVPSGEAQAFAATPPPGAAADWTPPADPQAARRAAREARAAARRASGGDRSTFPASVILGGFLIILGGFFLAREFLPQIDFDWFWPLVIVGLGVLLVVTSMRRPSEPG